MLAKIRSYKDRRFAARIVAPASARSLCMRDLEHLDKIAEGDLQWVCYMCNLPAREISRIAKLYNQLVDQEVA